MNNYRVADILHFKKYIFTDTNQSAPHFALVLLPSSIMNFVHNLMCCVITSKPTVKFSVVLLKKKYACFDRDSYACLNRRDINSVYDLSEVKQPVGRLDQDDIQSVFRLLKKIMYGSTDTFQVATIVREWKQLRQKMI